MLSTYDDLWAPGWKAQLEHMMVPYFEGFEELDSELGFHGADGDDVICVQTTVRSEGLGGIHQESIRPVLRGVIQYGRNV